MAQRRLRDEALAAWVAARTMAERASVDEGGERSAERASAESARDKPFGGIDAVFEMVGEGAAS
jgi:hypothetical protein